MPHVIVEYTDNLGDDARIPQLLQTLNETLIAQNGVFPTGGIRSRAIRLTDYRVADGKEDDACDALFDAIKAHFAEAFARRYLALSMELTEFDEGGSYKHNNIHARFRKA